jgi:hypothetical protein
MKSMSCASKSLLMMAILCSLGLPGCSSQPTTQKSFWEEKIDFQGRVIGEELSYNRVYKTKNGTCYTDFNKKTGAVVSGGCSISSVDDDPWNPKYPGGHPITKDSNGRATIWGTGFTFECGTGDGSNCKYPIYDPPAKVTRELERIKSGEQAHNPYKVTKPTPAPASTKVKFR